ncbi:DUF6191 domain-containing protein [Streptomyces sp. V4-01]|uniref:DUF6191 domain-containing protein n=1 Tax=Actinacidiphila polyblastidii TaxID=3110430 RepID=A0ABU7PDN6_9ACTN|nr:DUF6191 domain-containing protein [Streptomyces sp. V4-01]
MGQRRFTREAAMFNLIDELFVPGRKHTEDERNRLALTREEEGSNDPARGPIDLASGTVTIRPPRRDQDAAPGAAGSATPDGPAAAPGAVGPGAEPTASGGTAASVPRPGAPA